MNNGGLYEDLCPVEFLVGNRYWKIQDPKKNRGGTALDNGFAIFIKLKANSLSEYTYKLIDQVKIYLHPTFR